MNDIVAKEPDDFEAAFSLIAEADKKGETTPEIKLVVEAPVVEKTADQIAADTAAQAAADKVVADAAALEAANAGKTPEQIEAEAAAAEEARVAAEAKAATDAEALRAQQANESLAKTIATTIRQTDAEAAAAYAEAERARKAAAVEPPPLLSKEDLATVQAFEKDFPDVAKAQSIVRRAEYQQLTGHIFGEVEKFFTAKFAPMAELLTNLAERTHVGDLQTTVPNYDKLDVPALAAWVKTQPDYMQPALDAVMRNGTTAQVKDLVQRFYADTGVVITPPAPAKTAEELAAAAAQDTTRKKAVAALAPVVSKRSGATAAAPPEDFDNAFAAASRELEAAEVTNKFTR